MAMIHAVAPPDRRNLVNNMIRAWGLGIEAASGMMFKAEADESFTKETTVFYVLEEPEAGLAIFSKEVNMLAGRAFPASTGAVLSAVEQFSERLDADLMSRLQQYTELEFLKKTEDRPIGGLSKQMSVWLMYQALVFGFYYKLIEPLISMDFVQPEACFKGIWGEVSTTFLGMCIQFGNSLRRDGRVCRPHMLHMISTMYAGRQRWFFPTAPSHDLLGVLGPISVVSKPLLHTSDDPNEIGKIMLADLPILDLVAEPDGELFAGKGCGVTFDQQPYAGSASVGKPRPQGQSPHDAS